MKTKTKKAVKEETVIHGFKGYDKDEILFLKSAKIDGKKLKADTFYKVENGKFIKA
jgi:hypothetical protein